MTVVFWLLALGFLLILVGVIGAEARYQRMVNEWREQEPALDDHHITVWERLPLYDWAERGDL